ncbi:MAG: transposase [Acidimicrobiales bacterium]
MPDPVPRCRDRRPRRRPGDHARCHRPSAAGRGRRRLCHCGRVLHRWSHPGRCRTDGAYACLGGAAPIDASSGQTVRHRLNRGGDRQLNRALYFVALTRARCCPRTKAYIERRLQQGRTEREIQRCLKRYIARRVWRLLAHLAHTVTTTP